MGKRRFFYGQKVQRFNFCIMTCFFIFLSFHVFCGSVRLYNDSPTTLKAVVHGNDGSYLGEMLINPGSVTTWNDSQFSQISPSNQGDVSKTPYTVAWYCLDGSDYSVCYQVASASTVVARSCNGLRQCKSSSGTGPCPPQVPCPDPIPCPEPAPCPPCSGGSSKLKGG